jgi:outer membrane lipoprotein carrier protein
MKTVHANFSQTMVNDRSEVLQENTGDFYWQRPGKFNWHTKAPNEQWIIADGKKTWIYDVDLAQVTERLQNKTMGNTPALLLTGDSEKIVRQFKINLLRDNEDEKIFQLIPKANKNDSMSSMILIFNDKILTAIELADKLGQTTTIRLMDAKVNQPLAARLFQFSVPKNVDVVRE